jgi:hypothetical protein
LIQAQSDKQGAAGTYTPTRAASGSTRWSSGWTAATAPGRRWWGVAAWQRRGQHRQDTGRCWRWRFVACPNLPAGSRSWSGLTPPAPPRLRRRHRRRQPPALHRVRLRKPRPGRDPGPARAGMAARPGRRRAAPPGRLGRRACGPGPCRCRLAGGRPGRSAAGSGPTRRGAQDAFADPRGHRFQVFIANQPDPDPAVLEARRRPHAHVEGRIRAARASGLRNLPFFDFGANDAWLTWPWSPRPWSAGRRRCCWTAAARLPSQDLRFRLWHVAGRTVRHARRSQCSEPPVCHQPRRPLLNCRRGSRRWQPAAKAGPGLSGR